MEAIVPVAVTAVRFTKQFETIPRRIEFDGISYDLQHTYKKLTFADDAMTQFDVSDGTKQFRLLQTLRGWHLVSMSSIKP